MRDAGLSLQEGLQAYSCGDYDKTIDSLLRLREEMMVIGGSHVQVSALAIDS